MSSLNLNIQNRFSVFLLLVFLNNVWLYRKIHIIDPLNTIMYRNWKFLMILFPCGSPILCFFGIFAFIG